MTRVEHIKTETAISGGKINNSVIIAKDIKPDIEIALYLNMPIIVPVS